MQFPPVYTLVLFVILITSYVIYYARRLAFSVLRRLCQYSVYVWVLTVLACVCVCVVRLSYCSFIMFVWLMHLMVGFRLEAEFRKIYVLCLEEIFMFLLIRVNQLNHLLL